MPVAARAATGIFIFHKPQPNTPPNETYKTLDVGSRHGWPAGFAIRFGANHQRHQLEL
jgi:hypothetical protein